MAEVMERMEFFLKEDNLHEVIVPYDPNVSFIPWICDNLDGKFFTTSVKHWHESWDKWVSRFYFENPEDALLFKLRFG